MTLQVEFWELVGLVVTLFIAGLGALMAAGKALIGQGQRHIDARFAALEKSGAAGNAQLAARLAELEAAHRAETAQWQRVERELLTLKSDLPLHYVRREDYVPTVATIMTKFDALWLRLENLVLKGEVK